MLPFQNLNLSYIRILVLIGHVVNPRHLIQAIVQPMLLEVTLNEFIIHQIDTFDNCSHGIIVSEFIIHSIMYCCFIFFVRRKECNGS